MRRSVTALTAALSALGLLFCASIVGAQGSGYRAIEQITVDSTAGGVGFTSSKIAPAGGPQATLATCTLETADIRYTVDGTTPTSSVGMYWTSGASLTFASNDVLRAFRAIRVGSSSGQLDCTYSALQVVANLGPINGAGGGGGSSSSGGAVNIADPNTPANKVAVNGSGALSTTCSNCTGSGASKVDEVAPTLGTDSYAPSGGVFQTTATSNALTTGQGGFVQVTANRAFHINLRNASGTEIGTTSNQLQVGAPSGAFASGSFSSGALAAGAIVDGADVTQGAKADNKSTATDTTAISAISILKEISFMEQTPASRAVTNAGTFAVQAASTLSAETTKVIGTVRNVGNVGGVFDFAGQNASSPANAVLTGCQFNTTPTTITSTNASPCQLDSAGNLLVNIKAGSSSGAVAQGSTTSGQTGSLVQGAVTTAAPSYATAQTSPLSLDTAGSLRVAVQNANANGSAVSASSSPVVIASDQAAVAVKAASGAIASGAIASGAVASGAFASDSASFGVSATGAAPPAKAGFIGGLGAGATGGFLLGIPVCDSSKSVSMTSATTTLMVTGVSGRQVRICGLNLVTAIANNVALVEGTGATCGTGTAGMAGGSTAANGWNFAANGGITLGSGIGTVISTATTGDSVCIITSAAGPLAGTISYTIY